MAIALDGLRIYSSIQTQPLLGHDRLTTTEIYLNLSPEDVIREFREKW